MVLTSQRRRLWLAGAVVFGALAFVVVRGLDDATLYFRTADEAVAQRATLKDRRFRIQGIVVPGTVRQSGDDVAFDIESRGTRVGVRHAGDPPELFQPGIPVVLEGRFAARRAASRFESDRIMVKHSEQYQARHPERVQKR